MYFDNLDDYECEFKHAAPPPAADAPASPALFEMFDAAGCSPAEGLALAGFMTEER